MVCQDIVYLIELINFCVGQYMNELCYDLVY